MDLYVDAAKTKGGTTVGNTCGDTAWRGVIDLAGKIEVFRFPRSPKSTIEKGHNNPAEFCAIVDGLKYIQEHPNTIECLYTDSVTARSWVINAATKCKIRDQLGDSFRKEFEEREKWLRDFPLSNALKAKIKIWDKKIKNKENPADFGNKKNKAEHDAII